MRFLFLSLTLMASIAHAAATTQPAGFAVTKDAITIDPRVCTQGTGTLFFGLGSVQVRVVGQQDGQCVFEYTLEVEGGYTTWRCRVPVSDGPIVIQRNSNGAEPQKWVKTSFDLEKCEKIETGNVHLGLSTRPATQSTAQAAARAKVLKEQVKTFRLDLWYHGDQNKPYYALTLSVAPIIQTRSSPFHLIAHISEKEAGRIIDHLAVESFLDQAIDDASGMKLPAPPMPCYTMNVSCGGEAHRHEFYGVLGWGLPLLKRLDGLRTVLDEDAAKQMDVLLNRLNGQRSEWEKEGNSIATLVAGIKAILPKGWECSVISEPGKMGHPHGLEEPLFRVDFINQQESFQADGLPREKRRLHPSMRLHFHRIQDKQRIMKVIEAERLYSWDIPIYFSETKDYSIVTSPPWINQGWYTDEARKLIAPLEQALKAQATTQPSDATRGDVVPSPIERLAARLSADPLWQNGIAPIIALPQTASTEQVVSKVFEMISFDQGKVTKHRILEAKRVRIKGGLPDHYTAALIETNLGEKIVLFRHEGGAIGWWSRVYDNDSPASGDINNAWQAVLTAMQAGNKTALTKVTTEKGHKSIIMSRRGQEITPQDMQSYGRAWAKWPLRFTRRTEDVASTHMGPEVKEHGLEFVRTKEGWKLDQWLPGQ